MLGIPLYIGGAVAAVGTALAIGAVARRGARCASIPRSGSCSPARSPSGSCCSARSRTTSPDLFSYLLGNVLGITFADIVQIAILGGVVLLVVAVLRKELLYASFDPSGAAASGLPVVTLDYLLLGLVGVTIVVSIQAVGIIMVVAMLVTPAATGQLLVDKFWDLVKIAIGVAVVAAVTGLYVSFYLNVASGASIVLVETLLFGLALLFSPKSGWLGRRRRGGATEEPIPAASGSAAVPTRAPRHAPAVGIPSRAPARLTASEAATTARRAASGRSRPAARPAASAPLSVSPAPTVSTTCVRGGRDRPRPAPHQEHRAVGAQADQHGPAAGVGSDRATASRVLYSRTGLPPGDLA